MLNWIKVFLIVVGGSWDRMFFLMILWYKVSWWLLRWDNLIGGKWRYVWGWVDVWVGLDNDRMIGGDLFIFLFLE